MKLIVLSALLTLGLGTAATAASLTLDADTPETGANLQNSDLVTAFGTVTFNGEVRVTSDPDLALAGSTGNVFDIFSSLNPAVAFSFDFDVSAISLLYGGNLGGIDITIRDVNGAALDTFSQQSTGNGQPAGPLLFAAPGIRSLEWNDNDPSVGSFAALDNIELTIAAVPVPPALPLLAAAALGLFGLSRKRKPRC